MIKNLLQLNVQDHVEKKNGLTYLSWAWAWAEALKADPTASFHVDTFQRADGTTVPFMDINGTAMVWVRTTVFGKEMACFLPVMDHRNKPIPDPDAFQVNTAIMRCMTKCLALHGLGLYIYAGEDLPEQDTLVKAEKPAAPPVAPKVPAKAEGKPGRWQITINAKPDTKPTEWVNLFCEAAMVCLGQTESRDDCMTIYQVNNKLFLQLKLLDQERHKDLLGAFTTKKLSFPETSNSV